MYDRLKPLIEKAKLDIIEFGYHIRDEMVTINRCVDFYIMSYLKSGEAMLRINGQEYVATPGSVTLVPPNVRHDHIKISKERAVFLWWHFNFITPGNIDVLRFIDFPIITKVINTDKFENAFVEYLQAINNAGTLPGLVYKNAKALEVFAYLLEAIISSSNIKYENVPDVFFDILEDITKSSMANFSLMSLAKKYYMHPTYISNRFKQYFGITPIALHRILLIERAKELLLSTTLNINDISNNLGFSDVTVFTRFFTNKVGISPTEYRKHQIKHS